MHKTFSGLYHAFIMSAPGQDLITRIKMLPSIYVYVLMIFTLTACSQTPDKPVTKDAQITDINNTAISASDHERYNNGLTALRNDDFSKAQRIFKQFIEDKPNLAGAYSNLALIHFKNEEYEKSLDLVNKALVLNQEQAEAYQLRAQISLNKGKVHDAKNDYIKAVELKPDYANAQYNLALLYDIYLQEIALAIEHYKNYLKLINNTDEATQEWVDHLKRAQDNG